MWRKKSSGDRLSSASSVGYESIASHAEMRQQIRLAIGPGQGGGAASGRSSRTGWGSKVENQGWSAGSCGLGPQTLNDSGVTAMNPVKIADRHRTTAELVREQVQITDQLHGQ